MCARHLTRKIKKVSKQSAREQFECFALPVVAAALDLYLVASEPVSPIWCRRQRSCFEGGRRLLDGWPDQQFNSKGRPLDD